MKGVKYLKKIGTRKALSPLFSTRFRKEHPMPKLGMNMLLWTADVDEEHFPLFEELKKTGFDGVEIPLLVKREPAHYAKLRQALGDNGLECTTITVATADANPVNPDIKVQVAALDHLKWAIATSAVLGSKILCGPYHSAHGIFPELPPTPEELAFLRLRSASVLIQAALFAQRHGIVLAVEYLNRFECYLVNTADDLDALVGILHHPNCRPMYDTFHAHIEERNVNRTLSPRAQGIAHVHVSENNRGVPGSGQVNWHWTFKALKDGGYDGWYTIEAFGHKLPSLAAATKIWRPLFTSEAEVCTKGFAFMRAMLREDRSH